MTIPNPEHFFQQAELIISSSVSRRPRQANLRRAISSAYYAVFHAAAAAAADLIVRHKGRAIPQYGLVYRSIDHRTLRDLCLEIQKPRPSRRYLQYVPRGGFGPDIVAFAEGVIDLQARRHDADYDPLIVFERSDARFAIDLGRTALRRFARTSGIRRTAFLILLLFPPRQ